MTTAADITWDGDQLMAASMDAMAVIDGSQHITVNELYADLYGFPRPDALAGESWAHRFAKDERTRIEQEILPACRNDGQWRGTVTGRRHNGTTFSHEPISVGCDTGISRIHPTPSAYSRRSRMAQLQAAPS